MSYRFCLGVISIPIFIVACCGKVAGRLRKGWGEVELCVICYLQSVSVGSERNGKNSFDGSFWHYLVRIIRTNNQGNFSVLNKGNH